MVLPTIHEDTNDGLQQPSNPDDGSGNIRPSSNGYLARKDPHDTSSNSPPERNESGVMVQLVDVHEMARILQVPVSWLYQRTRRKTIPCVRVGKYVRFEPMTVIAHYQAQDTQARSAGV